MIFPSLCPKTHWAVMILTAFGQRTLISFVIIADTYKAQDIYEDKDTYEAKDTYEDKALS